MGRTNYNECIYASGGGWLVSLIWAMMILPLADALQNCFQNLTSRIAGLDNEQMTNRVMGMGAMLGFSTNAIKEQFKTPNSNIASNSNNDDSSNNKGNGLKGIVSRAKTIINPQMNLSDSKDYNGNVNPIRDVLDKKDDNKITLPQRPENNNVLNMSNGKLSKLDMAKGIGKTGLKAGKAYMQVGKAMAEGDFRNFKNKKVDIFKTNAQNT